MHTAEQLQVICFRAGVPPRHWQLPQRQRQKGKGQGIPPLLPGKSTALPPPPPPDLWLSCSARLIRPLIDIRGRVSPLSNFSLVLEDAEVHWGPSHNHSRASLTAITEKLCIKSHRNEPELRSVRRQVLHSVCLVYWFKGKKQMNLFNPCSHMLHSLRLPVAAGFRCRGKTTQQTHNPTTPNRSCGLVV